MRTSLQNTIVQRDTWRLSRPLQLGIALNNSPASKIPLVAKLVALTAFFPQELSFYVFGLRLTAVRVIFLLTFPILLGMFGHKIATGHYRFVVSDLFVFLTGFWLIYGPANIDGLIPALNHAGPDVLEFCTAYMTTRFALQRHDEAVKFVQLLCKIIAFVAIIGLLDSITSSYFVRDLSRHLTGFNATNINDWSDSYRLGILRATGPIEHPILYGFTCVVGVILAVNIRVGARILIISLSALGTIFSFSSAPLQCLILSFCLLIYGRKMAGVRFRWTALLVVLTVGIILIVLISASPIGFISSHFIYDSSSGYYRSWTWDRVIYYVSQSPWYGLGYGIQPDDINHSIDSLWLVLAIHAGVPGALLTAICLIGSASIPTNGRTVNLSGIESRLGTALGILIFITIYMAFTVHLWGSVWILIGLIAGLRGHLGELGQLPPEVFANIKESQTRFRPVRRFSRSLVATRDIKSVCMSESFKR